MPSIAAAATVKILLGRGTRDWRMSFSLVVGGEVVDGVTALRVEAGDARDRVDAAREPAPGNEHDRVDGLGDQPARDGDDAFLNKLFEPVARGGRAVCLACRHAAWLPGVAAFPDVQHHDRK